LTPIEICVKAILNSWPHFNGYILNRTLDSTKMTKIYNKDMTSREDSSPSSPSESNGLPPAKSFSANKVKKSTTSHKMDVTNDEMQSLLAKLKELVPNIPRHKKVSRLEIIQYVIDYIFDLQVALESHPQSICQPLNNSSPTSSTSLRQPLAIKYSS